MSVAFRASVSVMQQSYLRPGLLTNAEGFWGFQRWTVLLLMTTFRIPWSALSSGRFGQLHLLVDLVSLIVWSIWSASSSGRFGQPHLLVGLVSLIFLSIWSASFSGRFGQPHFLVDLVSLIFWSMDLSLLRLLDHTQTHSPGRTPRNEWAARSVYRYLHSKHKRRTSMPSAGLEPAIPLIKRPRTYALCRMDIGDQPLCMHLVALSSLCFGCT